MKRRRGAAAITVIATALAMTVVVPGAAEAEGTHLGFDFDHGPSGHSDTDLWDSGCFSNAGTRGCVQVSQDAALRPVPRADGSALRFPGKGSAVIRVAHDATFNPGRADFTISALIRLTPKQVKGGANVIQKGRYDSKRGQWKLQVDSGVPSCRVAGGAAESRFTTAKARAQQRLTADRWTSIRCVREGSRLRLYVDGTEVDSAGKADVNIDNRDPVLIGGKHAGESNDQFRGDLDDVGVAIG